MRYSSTCPDPRGLPVDGSMSHKLEQLLKDRSRVEVRRYQEVRLMVRLSCGF